MRLFANLGEQFELVARSAARDAGALGRHLGDKFSGQAGRFNYQPDFLDPIGRTVMISIRKLFLPPPSFFRRQQEERQQQQQEPTR